VSITTTRYLAKKPALIASQFLKADVTIAVATRRYPKLLGQIHATDAFLPWYQQNQISSTLLI
jgi:hypothetical protein